MAVAIVQSASTTAASTTVTLAFPTTPTIGNLIIAVLNDNTIVTGTTINPASGSSLTNITSQVSSNNNATLRLAAGFYVSGNGNSYSSFNSSATSQQMTLYEISGVESALIPSLTYATNNFSPAGLTATTPTLSVTAGPSGAVLAFLGVVGGSVGALASTPMTMDQTTIRTAAASTVASSLASSYSDTFTWTTSRIGMTIIVAISNLGKASTLMMAGMGT